MLMLTVAQIRAIATCGVVRILFVSAIPYGRLLESLPRNTRREAVSIPLSLLDIFRDYKIRP